MPELATKYRTHTCGELRPTHIPAPPEPGAKKQEPKEVLLCGHVDHRVDARTIFVRDAYGKTLVTVGAGAYPYVAERIEKLGLEDAIQVGGHVGPRSPIDEENPTGAVQLEAQRIEVISSAAPPPDGLMTDAKVAFADRLAYRNYYMRRLDMQKRLAFRAQVVQEAREYFMKRRFLELETPQLFWYDAVATAGEVIPNGGGRAWRTPSGPVVLDQYINAGQFDRFFQFNKITRKEEPGTFTEWHQQEHIGLDVNLAYVDLPDFCAMVEGLVAHVYKSCLGIEIKTPFAAVSYAEAMLKFGTDKPDTRFDLHIVDLPAAAAREGGIARAFRAPGGAKIEDKVLEPLLERLKGAAKLSYVRIDNMKKLTGPATALFTDPQFHDSSKYRETLLGTIGATTGDLVVIATAPREDDAAIGAGRARVEVAKLLGLGKGVHQGTWVYAYPFLEEDEGKHVARVIVFSKPVDEDAQGVMLEPGKRHLVRSRAFDLVLNGQEIASAYIGNHVLQEQKLIWQILFLTEHADLFRLRAPIEAHRFAVPPHGGMNLGFDRMVALMLGIDAIDEVMHFPKDAHCRDPFLGAPGAVPPEVVAPLLSDAPKPAHMTIENLTEEVMKA